MTVIDGEFPNELMKEHDLTVSHYQMGTHANTTLAYDCKLDGPGYDQGGVLIEGEKAEPWYKRVWK